MTPHLRVCWLIPAVLITLIPVRHVRAQPAHAIEPLPTPWFSITRTSPSAGIGNLRGRDILDKPGPTVIFSGAALGMSTSSPFADELDDFSTNRNSVTDSQTFVILFSIDKTSTGGVQPDPTLVSLNRPFNALDQALKKQAPGDIFMSTLTFTRAGLGDLAVPRGPGASGNNTLVKNQGDTGGTDMNLEKKIPPEKAEAVLEPADELDGISEKEDTGAPFAFGVPSMPMIFYTLRNGSPSLNTLPGTPSGANVYVDFNPSAPGGETLYAGASLLGLAAGATGDDIDGLIVFDDGDGIYEPNVDQILFSLARGSPFLGNSGFGPADILSRRNGATTRFCNASDLGLLATDNLDAIEILPTNNVADTLFKRAIFRVLPGDVDHNDVLNQVDCGAFAVAYSGPGVSYDTNGQVTRDVQVGPGAVFNPMTVTIETGDSVRWTWMGGVHNVVSGSGGAADGAFASGAPTGVIGTTFTVPFGAAMMNAFPKYQGRYDYFSSPDLPGMAGAVVVVAHPAAALDLDYDGDVDCADWLLFKGYFSQFNGVRPCLPLTIPEFIAALLGSPLLPAHSCIADVNDDGAVNGRDIAPYVAAVLP